MLPRLFPHLSFAADETAVSWAARLAAFHTGGRVKPFLLDLGIRPTDLIGGLAGSIGKLCALGGEDEARVGQNVVWRTARRRYRLRHEEFSAEFLVGSLTAFCPACLFEDDAAGGDVAVHRRGRLVWGLRAVRTCPIHGCPIVVRPKPPGSENTYEMAVRVPERGSQLLELRGTTRTCSPLQDYILGRLEGAKGPDWLDGQTIEQAMRATEMLGVLLVFGQTPNLERFTSDDWDRAGRAGFEVTSHGYTAIRNALGDVQWAFKEGRGTSRAGRYFGPLFQWLQFPASDKDPGPIRDILRDQILDTFEVEPGTTVLGQVLHQRRRHSVSSLARHAGVHPLTLQNLLIAKSMIPPDANRSSWRGSFDAAEGEKIAAAMKRAVPMIDLPRALNTTRAQAEQLVGAGILKPLDDAESRPRGQVGGFVDQTDIDEFLSRIGGHAREVAVAPAGFVSIPKAAQKSRARAADIVRLILGRKLERLCRLRDMEGYASILVDPEEIRLKLRSDPKAPSRLPSAIPQGSEAAMAA